MFLNVSAVRRVYCLVVVLVPMVCPLALHAEPAVGANSDAFEVAANDVYVRSGGSMNHYTICKLNAGDRVTVVAKKGNWCEILPPAGTFSLISGDYVDTADDKSGVINGNNVRIRAGSLLNTHKYTVQRLLSKGAEVTILGRNADGFLRIVPPEGATLWISADFLAPMSSGEIARRADETSVGQTSGDDSSPSGRSETDAGADSDPLPSRGEARGHYGTMLAALPATRERRTLATIDADVEVELAKPLLERKIEPFVERYQVLVDQDEDAFAKRYALTRVEQLNTMNEIAATVRKVRTLGDRTDARRLEFLAERTERRQAEVPTPSGIDARGVLRVSALYPEGSLPRRYRLVDTSTSTERTVAYVDIPADASMNINALLGRYVGVRASRKRLMAGGVNPIPILVARELVPLESMDEGMEEAAQH